MLKSITNVVVYFLCPMLHKFHEENTTTIVIINIYRSYKEDVSPYKMVR